MNIIRMEELQVEDADAETNCNMIENEILGRNHMVYRHMVMPFAVYFPSVKRIGRRRLLS